MSDELCDFDYKHSCASDSIASVTNSDENDSDSDLNSEIELREDDWREEFDEDKILEIQYHDIVNVFITLTVSHSLICNF